MNPLAASSEFWLPPPTAPVELEIVSEVKVSQRDVQGVDFSASFGCPLSFQFALLVTILGAVLLIVMSALVFGGCPSNGRSDPL